MGTQRTASMKLGFIINKIKEQSAWGLATQEDVLLSEFCLIFNSQKKTALEIIKNLENTKRILRKENKLYSSVYFDENFEFINKEVSTELSEEEKEILNEDCNSF